MSPSRFVMVLCTFNRKDWCCCWRLALVLIRGRQQQHHPMLCINSNPCCIAPHALSLPLRLFWEICAACGAQQVPFQRKSNAKIVLAACVFSLSRGKTQKYCAHDEITIEGNLHYLNVAVCMRYLFNITTNNPVSHKYIQRFLTHTQTQSKESKKYLVSLHWQEISSGTALRSDRGCFSIYTQRWRKFPFFFFVDACICVHLSSWGSQFFYIFTAHLCVNGL